LFTPPRRLRVGAGFYKLHIYFATKTTPGLQVFTLCVYLLKGQWLFHNLTLYANQDTLQYVTIFIEFTTICFYNI
jgi:hypothetical protein